MLPCPRNSCKTSPLQRRLLQRSCRPSLRIHALVAKLCRPPEAQIGFLGYGADRGPALRALSSGKFEPPSSQQQAASDSDLFQSNMYFGSSLWLWERPKGMAKGDSQECENREAEGAEPG